MTEYRCVCVFIYLYVSGMEFRAVFVSTVRSRHRVSQMATSGVGEFGFLSESQLVNTALTRARSWLAVIGDPVALCSIGNCGALWRTYLKHCQKAGGIHPTDLSLEDIWQHSQTVTNLLTVNTVNTGSSVLSTVLSQGSRDPHGQSQDVARASPLLTVETVSSASVSTSSASSLSATAAALEPYKTVSVGESQRHPSVHASQTLPLQSSGVPRSHTHRIATQRTATQARSQAQARGRHAVSEHSSSEECNSDDKPSPGRTESRGHRAAAAAAGVMTASVISFAEWSLDYQLEPDEIIRQLVKVCILVSCIFVQEYCCALIFIFLL